MSSTNEPPPASLVVTIDGNVVGRIGPEHQLEGDGVKVPFTPIVGVKSRWTQLVQSKCRDHDTLSCQENVTPCPGKQGVP